MENSITVNHHCASSSSYPLSLYRYLSLSLRLLSPPILLDVFVRRYKEMGTWLYVWPLPEARPEPAVTFLRRLSQSRGREKGDERAKVCF
ncbi:hypothetical protein Hanom_Chr01g00045321 [Helianthus anomalus]